MDSIVFTITFPHTHCVQLWSETSGVMFLLSRIVSFIWMFQLDFLLLNVVLVQVRT